MCSQHSFLNVTEVNLWWVLEILTDYSIAEHVLKYKVCNYDWSGSGLLQAKALQGSVHWSYAVEE